MAYIPAAHPPTRGSRAPSVSPDWRAAVAGAVAGWSAISPYLSLRYGGAVLGLLALSRLTTHRPRRADLLMLGFAAFGGFSYFWAADQDVTWIAIQDLACATAIFIGTRMVCTTIRAIRIVSCGFLVGCGYTAINLWFARNDAAPIIYEGVDISRAGLSGVNANYSAYVLATGVALVVVLTLTARRRRYFLAVICGVVGALGIYLTGTRGAEVALVLITLCLLGTWRAPRVTFRILCIGAIVSALGILTGVADQWLSPQTQPGRESGDLNGRLTMWPVARALIETQPLQGYGLGSFRVLNPMKIVAHDALLEVAVGLGLVGLALFLAVLWQALVFDSRGLSPRLRGYTVGVLIAALVPIMLSGAWSDSPVAWLSIAVLSMATVFSEERASAENLCDPLSRAKGFAAQ